MGGGVRHKGTVGTPLLAPWGTGVSLGVPGNSAVGMAAPRERCEAEVSAGGL